VEDLARQVVSLNEQLQLLLQKQQQQQHTQLAPAPASPAAGPALPPSISFSDAAVAKLGTLGGATWSFGSKAAADDEVSSEAFSATIRADFVDDNAAFPTAPTAAATNACARPTPASPSSLNGRRPSLAAPSSSSPKNRGQDGTKIEDLDDDESSTSSSSSSEDEDHPSKPGKNILSGEQG
jgi:hypothetical protein